MNTIRYAVVTGASPDTVERYLPSGYRVYGTAGDGRVLVAGTDHAGWTMQDYVLPRLRSGLYGAREITRAEAATIDVAQAR